MLGVRVMGYLSQISTLLASCFSPAAMFYILGLHKAAGKEASSAAPQQYGTANPKTCKTVRLADYPAPRLLRVGPCGEEKGI